jgi:hypothetical protein
MPAGTAFCVLEMEPGGKALAGALRLNKGQRRPDGEDTEGKVRMTKVTCISNLQAKIPGYLYEE